MDQQDPGIIAAIIRRLRGSTGLQGQQDLSAAGAAQTLQQQPGLREMQIRAAESGVPVEEYIRLQQQGQMFR